MPNPAGLRGPVPGLVRQTVELLVFLSLCVILARTFSAEAYVVPTGSMAPTLLGWHRELVCPNCGFVFLVGIDEEGSYGAGGLPELRSGRPGSRCRRSSAAAIACSSRSSSTISGGPKRWEVAVFHFPGDPSQAYVKRVVGLPGESIRILDGDIFVDGQIVRKTLEEQRAMRILVHDSSFRAARLGPIPALDLPVGLGLSLASRPDGSRGDQGFVHRPTAGVGPGDWIIYRHWDPARRRYGPVRDFYAYNGGELPAENEVVDLGLEARDDGRTTRSRRSRRPSAPGRTSSSCGSRSGWEARSSWSITADTSP